MTLSGRTRGPACPERTCIGCRKRAAKNDLLRVAVSGGRCVPDHRGTLSGRGAYVHPDLACLDLAVRRRAFARAFRAPVPPDSADLRRYVETAARAARQAARQEE